MLCASDKDLLWINLKGSITSPGIRPGNLKSTRIEHVKVTNISFFPWVKTLRLKLKACGFFSLMLDEGIDWTGEKATAIYTTSVKNSGIYKLSEVDCLDACHYYSYAGAAHEYSWLWASLFFIFMKRFNTALLSNLKIPFINAMLAGQKSIVDLEVMESKTISSPFTTTNKPLRKSFLSIQTCCPLDDFFTSLQITCCMDVSL